MILLVPTYHIQSTTFTVDSSIIVSYQSGAQVMGFSQKPPSDNSHDSRLTRIETKIEAIEASINRVDTAVGKLSEKIDSNFKWLLAIFIPLFVTGTAATIFTIIFKH